MAGKRPPLLRRLARAWDVVRGTPTPARRASDFRGAALSRHFADVQASLRSVDLETKGDLALLRARARKLVRDNSYAAGFVGEVVSNVIGPAGIRLQARVRDAAGAFRRDVNTTIETQWRAWGAPEWASASGKLSWRDLQRLLFAQLATDGELLFEKVRFADTPFGYTLHPLDPDYLDHTLNVAEGTRGLPAGVSIRMGVECDQRGRPIAYHLWDRHPSETGRKHVRRVADDIVHDFIAYRVGQVRGVTWFAPVLSDALVFDSFTQAELKTARTAAATMGFILNKSEAAIAAYHDEQERSRLESGEATVEPLTFEADPGVIHELAPGQEIGQFDPAHPSPEFTAFCKVILRGIARGLGMAYTTLTGDLEAVNYSSIRAGLLGERDIYRMLQEWTAEHVHRPVYRGWLEMAVLTPDGLGLPTRTAAEYHAVEWQGRGWAWVDPLKDIQAAKEAIALGMDTRTRLCAERGLDYEEILATLAEEEALAKEYGVAIAGADASAGAETARQIDEQDADEEETRDREEQAARQARQARPAPPAGSRVFRLPTFRRRSA